MKKLLIAFALTLLPATVLAEEATQTIIDFNGEFVDQNAAPLAGVLPLEFRVFADNKSKKALATEKHFVAVVDGQYAITLGETGELKTTADKLYVAVYLDGKELTRQEVSTQRQLVASNPKVVVTPNAGRETGDSFKLECPSGYVVTGIEGSAQNGIQGLKLICSQAVQLH